MKRNIVITIISVLILTCLFAFARTTTTDLELIKPTWDESLDILDDINANSDILEAFANDPLLDDAGERVEDRAGAMWTGNTETGITVTYQDGDNTIDAVIGADDIVQTMLKCVNEPIDEDIFTYESTTGDFEWHTLAELSIQPLDTALTNISALAYVSPSFIKLTADDTYVVRTLAEVKTDLSLNNVTNDAQIAKSIGTAQGDLIYFTASATPTVLPKGTATQVLTMNAGATAPEWAAGGGGYTNLTSFVDQTAFRVFYSDTAGDVTELALGTDGQVLTSAGVDVAPTFEDAGGGALTFLELTDTPAAYDDGKYAKSTAAGVIWDTPAGAGETNTASNIGAEVEIFKQKTGVDLELRTLKANSAKVTISNETAGGAIDMGSAAIDRNSYLGTGFTWIALNNPVLQNGTINSVELWFDGTDDDGTNVAIIIFEEVDTDTFTARDYEVIGTVTKGSKQTEVVDLTVVTGDYIGIYYDSARLEKTTNVGTGLYKASGDQKEGTSVLFDLYEPEDDASLYATGTGDPTIQDYVKFDVVPAEIAIDTLGTPTDITDLNASITAHGLLPKLPNDDTKVLDGVGAWVVPAGGDALTTDPLSQFAPTTSAQLAGVISDEIGAGKLRFDTSVTAKTTTATLTEAEAGTILCSAASAYTITLPTAVGNTGLTYKFVKTDANYNLITLDGDGTETINYENSTGAPVLTYARLNTYCAEATFVADGANWQVMDEALGQVPYAHVGCSGMDDIIHLQQTTVNYDTEYDNIGSCFDNSTWVSGNATATTADHLVDSGGAFTSAMVGYRVKNTTDTTYAYITAFTSSTDITVSPDIFVDTEGYEILHSEFTTPVSGIYLIAQSTMWNNLVADKRYDTMLYLPGLSQHQTQSSITGSLTFPVTLTKKIEKDEVCIAKVRHFAGANTIDLFGNALYNYLIIKLISKD